MHELYNHFLKKSKFNKIMKMANISYYIFVVIYFVIAFTGVFILEYNTNYSTALVLLISLGSAIILGLLTSMIYESFSISKILENDLSAPKNIKRFGFRFANNSKFQGKIAEHDKNNLEKLLKRNSLYNLEKIEFIIQRYEEKIEKKELEVFNRIALILFVIALFEFIGSEMFHYTIRVLTVIVLATIVFLPMIGKKILMNFKGNPMMSISTEKYFVDLLGEIYLEIKE